MTSFRNRPKLDNLLSNIKKLDNKAFYDESIIGGLSDKEKYYFLYSTIKKI